MLRSDENRERTAYTCIMYMYMYIIISHIYISLYRAFYFCLKFISSFFSFRDDGMPDGRHGKRWRTPVGVFFFLFFVSFTRIKGRFPPLHSPRIYLILVLFFIFLFFFSLLLFYYTCTHRRVTESLATRARVFHDSNYAFFLRSLSLSLSIFRYSLTIIITIRLDC